LLQGESVEYFEGIVEQVCRVHGFLDSRHVFVLVHVVLDVGLASLHFSQSYAFSSEVSGAVAIVALLNSLRARVALEWFPYLGNISLKALLVGHSV